MTTLLKTPEALLDSRIKATYQFWQDGTLMAAEALAQLCALFAPAQDQLKSLEKSDKQARAYISEIVEYLGGQAEVDGFGEMKITSPSITYTYDKKLVSQLTNELRTEGFGDIATRLDACLKASEKVGSLRVTREKIEGSDDNA